MRTEKYSRPLRQHQDQRVAFAVESQRLPDDTIGQKAVDPAAVAWRTATHRTIRRRATRPKIFHARMATGDFMARRIEHRCPDVLLAPEIFHVVVGGGFATAHVGVHDFRENLRPLTLDAVPRRAEGNRDQNRQHEEERLRGPEGQENFEEEAFHYLLRTLPASSCWLLANRVG